MSEMFCFQCEQTAGGCGCTVRGVCGKDAETAALQDLLLAELKEVAHAAVAGEVPAPSPELLAEALFTTVTNVNFDPDQVAALTRQVAAVRGTELPADRSRLLEAARRCAFPKRCERIGEEAAAAGELLLYGLKGTAAYYAHALRLGASDQRVPAFLLRALAVLRDECGDVGQLTALILECGQINLTAMELLDRAHTEHFGAPEPTPVRITPVRGKAVLISGHDLRDLEELLKQCAGLGVNVYTHGEMLPAHAYPKLRRYPHLVGNYGGAWQDQKREFAAFPGAILMTTNCLQEPQPDYRERIFTTGPVYYPGVRHLRNGDFSPVILEALRQPGFTEEVEPPRWITVGYGHQAVKNAAGVILDAIQSGAIRHFFLIGGCDGARSGRNYYTHLAEKVPADCLILTLACGKYRFNKLEFGKIGELPRLLDCGQCNDAYSAIRIVGMLSEALHTPINRLPLTIVLSWYEQKAVAVLLTLLSLGITRIKLGPTLPAFVSPGMLKLLVDKFALSPTADPETDLIEALNYEFY